MITDLKKIHVICLLAMSGLLSCSDPWDDRSRIQDENLRHNLFEQIVGNPETEAFGELLSRVEFDSILGTSGTYTVWAPGNAAMSQVTPSELDNEEKIVSFIKNHIAVSSYASDTGQDTVTLKMLTQKYLQLKPGRQISDAGITTPDLYASNGLYHIVDKALPPKPNIWEFIKQNTSGYEMAAYMAALDDIPLFEGDSAAFADSGEDANPLKNPFLYHVYDLGNEKNNYTLLLLNDESFQAETDKLTPYLTKGTEDSTMTYAGFYAIRDLAYQELLTVNALPDTLVSKFGVKIPSSGIAVQQEVSLSNGKVLVAGLNVPVGNRLVPLVIEGERPDGFSDNEHRSNTFYRDKIDPDGVLFNDIMVQNHRVPKFSIYYHAPHLFSTTYEVYWRAINDIQSNDFEQQVSIGGIIDEETGAITDPIAVFPYTNVEMASYTEKYIGEFTLEEAGAIDLIALIAANSSTDGVNTLTLDYLKLIPVVKE